VSSETDGAIIAIQSEHRRCVRCVEAGYLARAHPVFSGSAGQRIMLVGQAPGPVEDDVTRPFAGRAGAQLMRWFTRAGFDGERDVRERVFMTSMTTCFPGRLPNNAGDRRPGAAEVALCRPWLDTYLDLLRPALLICVGGLAHGRFLHGRRLETIVGQAWSKDGELVEGIPAHAPVLLPLPHPSGQSRWLNDPEHVLLLDSSLDRLRQLSGWAASTSTASSAVL
jgi:uracil-DNA glycosylase family 4